jgi:hypothetical protein
MPLDDAFTVALLHMNGADAGTTFTDESGKSWTANGNTQLDTGVASPLANGDAVGLFDGTGDYLSAADSADWQLDGGSDSNEWTIDFWVRFNGDPGTAIMGFIQQRVDNDNFWDFILTNNTLNILVRSGGVNTVNLNNAWNPAGSTWYHVAIVKQGTTGYLMFVDGTQIGTTQTDTSTMPNFAGGITIGRRVNASGVAQELNGWLDEFRISKGVARWTANFTTPKVEYLPGSFFF